MRPGLHDLVVDAWLCTVEDPYERMLADSRDRSVTELHRRVGLAPGTQDFAELEGRFRSDPGGDAATEEDELLRRPRRLRARIETSWASACDADASTSQPQEDSRRASAVVAKRVWTTDCSSAKASGMCSLTRSAKGLAGSGANREDACTQSNGPDSVENLGRRP